MKIDVLKLSKEETLNYEFRLFQDDLSGYGDVYDGKLDASGILVKGKIRKEGALLYRIAFHLTGQIVYPCARCLDPVTIASDFEFDDTVAIDEGMETIDLIPYVEECLFINEPFKVLCDEDCKGLCPNCGANLNHESCSCSVEAEIDPRMEALKKLL